MKAVQVTTLKKLYQGPKGSEGHEIFPGYLPGAEEGPGGWGTWITGPAPGKSLLFAFSGGYFSNIVYEQGDWNYKDASIDATLKAAAKKAGTLLTATGATMPTFKTRR